jgi:large subunit ribosomal protein L24
MKILTVKRNDMVVVLSGEDRGKIGKVLAAYPGKNRVLVEGVNVIKKGGIITKEGSIHISKVMKQDRYEARRKKHGGTTATAEA